jgi:hypothetical protein
LQSNEFFRGATFKSKKGELFFGGINGLNSFDPDNIIEQYGFPTPVSSISGFLTNPFVPDTRSITGFF